MEEYANKELNAIVNYIKNMPSYIRYNEIRNFLNGQDEIMGIINNIKSLQKDIIKKESLKQDTASLEEDLKKEMEVLNSYPIYQEYMALQDEINLMLQETKITIDNYFNELCE